MSDTNPAVIAALSKLSLNEAKTCRSSLQPGQYAVEETLLVSLQADVRVGQDYTQHFVEKAKPWALVQALLSELNLERAAAGKLGLDMAQVVAMARQVDPSLAEQAKQAASEEMAKIKAPTRQGANGKVTVNGTLGIIWSSKKDGK